MNFNRKDVGVAAIAGALIAILVLPIIDNIGLPSMLKSFGTFGVSAALFILTVIGFIFLNTLSRWLNVLRQIAKFIVVGGLNTFLDFAILNFLIASSGIASGFGFSFFKGISFLVAVINSYFWNKHWTFETKTNGGTEFIQFAVVSTIGLFINVGIASFIVNAVGPVGNITPVIWANTATLIAVAGSQIWNFLSYKFVVFRK